jgi:hypothetical protein
MTLITEDQVEAAARALHEVSDQAGPHAVYDIALPPWESLDDETKNFHRSRARAALSAALEAQHTRDAADRAKSFTDYQCDDCGCTTPMPWNEVESIPMCAECGHVCAHEPGKRLLTDPPPAAQHTRDEEARAIVRELAAWYDASHFDSPDFYDLIDRARAYVQQSDQGEKETR